MKQKNKALELLVKYRVFVIFLALFVIMSVFSDSFLTRSNMLNMLRQLSTNGILAVGMTFVLITGGIDLSVGSVLTFSAMVGCSFIQEGSPYPVAMAVAISLAVGLGIGLLNGVLVAYGRVPAFIVTLGTQLAASGAALMFRNGSPIPGLKSSFNAIGAGSLAGIPMPIIIFFVIMLAGGFVLRRTRFGRYTYAVGGNTLAARACGIKDRQITVSVYVISGLCAAIAGIVLAARVRTATPLAGDGSELDAIAAAVLGGTSLTGGIGSMWGTLAGVLIIGLLNNGMDMLNIQSYIQDIVQGAIIVAAVLIDVNTNRNSK